MLGDCIFANILYIDKTTSQQYIWKKNKDAFYQNKLPEIILIMHINIKTHTYIITHPKPIAQRREHRVQLR